MFDIVSCRGVVCFCCVAFFLACLTVSLLDHSAALLFFYIVGEVLFDICDSGFAHRRRRLQWWQIALAMFLTLVIWMDEWLDG